MAKWQDNFHREPKFGFESGRRTSLARWHCRLMEQTNVKLSGVAAQIGTRMLRFHSPQEQIWQESR